MSNESRLAILARLEEIREACDFVVEAAEHAGLDERAVYHCQMAVDETLTNVIEHGYDYHGDEQEVEIICKTDTTHFFITIAEGSPAFNPLEHDAPDPAASLDDREPGGWGIYFIRRLMDDVTYAHHNGRNHLTLIKKLPEEATQTAPHPDDSFPVRALDNGAAAISPAGRLDSKTSPRLESVLNAQLQQGITWLYVDMSGVDYIASSGLKILVACWRRAREEGGDVILSNLQPRIVEIFEMVGFDMLFNVYPDLDTALTARSTSG